MKRPEHESIFVDPYSVTLIDQMTLDDFSHRVANNHWDRRQHSHLDRGNPWVFVESEDDMGTQVMWHEAFEFEIRKGRVRVSFGNHGSLGFVYPWLYEHEHEMLNRDPGRFAPMGFQDIPLALVKPFTRVDKKALIAEIEALHEEYHVT